MPQALLAQGMQAARDQQVQLDDPIAQMEWHIEFAIAWARARHLAEQKARGVYPLVLYHAPGDTLVTHTYWDREHGREVERGCETALPAPICACGRYAIERAEIPV